MNNLMIFENCNVEIITNEAGEPLFELYSTGAAIGQFIIAKGKVYSNKRRIENNIENAGIKPVLRNAKLYLTEEMLYDFMLEAKTDKCRKFRKWVTSEVLPSIRKNGGFLLTREDDTDEDILARAILIAQNTINKKDRMIKEQRQAILIQEKEIEILEPQAKKWNIFLNEEGLITIDSFSKNLGIKGFGRNNMYKFMKDNKYLKWDNTPYARFVNEMQLFKTKTAGYHFEGIRKVEDTKTYLTRKGVDYFLNKFSEENII